MGIVRMGVPKDIVIYLRDLCKITAFIETGTFHGWTSYWASEHFTSVKTIEFSEKIYREAIKTHDQLNNVEFIFGDSRKELRKIIENSDSPFLFWLDAHFCSFGSYGENDQCPLIEEIGIIFSSNIEHILIIDDARLFLAPPPLPNSVKFYPSISEILSVFIKMNYYTIIYEDVIIGVPSKYKDEFINFIQQKTTKDAITYGIILKKKERAIIIKRIIKKMILYKYWSELF